MQIWQAIILGAVQGFAEFLPISSSGHLILLQRWFGIKENAFYYSIMLHIGTLVPVFIVFWKQIVELFKRPFNRLGYLILASIPAGVVGGLISFIVDLDSFFVENVWLLSITFLLTAVELYFSEKLCKKRKMLATINSKTSLGMGLGQALAVVPGLSRSGTTISAGCILGVEKGENANFTFLMSISIILAAVFLEVLSGFSTGAVGNVSVIPLLFGVVTSAVCGYIAIKTMLSIVKKANYKWFCIYLILISILTGITSFMKF